MSTWKTESHVSRALKSAELVEYRCLSCKQGFYRHEPNEKRITKNNQIPHRCTNCKELVYFPYPYPIVSLNGKRFVFWDVIRGENIDPNSSDFLSIPV